MQVSVEATGAIGRRMTVALPADRFEAEYTARIQRLGRSARLPGFRPGKAPLKLVEAQFGGKLSEEILTELIQASFHEAVSQQECADTPEGQVLQQLRKGYKLRDRLLRPASVIVAKMPAAPSPDTAAEMPS